MNPTFLRPHRGDLVLNLSILSLCCFPLGILAWILGSRDLSSMNAGDAGAVNPAGRGTIQCARFIGIAGAIVNFLVFAVVAIALSLIFLGARAFL